MKKIYAIMALLFTFLMSTVASPIRPADDDVDPSTLTGRDLYDYQMSHLNFFRLKNKRTATSYLTTNTAGSAIGARKATSGLSQIWIAEKSGNGYTLRSANTGQYLQGNFPSPSGNKTTLYFQFSPNNTGKQSFVNISSAANFSGQTCLNLNGDGKTLYKWSYAGDPGSDWAIELAEDVTEDEIKAHFAELTGYAQELSEGKYYRLIAAIYGLALTEGSDLSVKAVDPSNFAQYWQLTKVGNNYAIQSVVSGKYVQRQTSTSVPFHMGSSKVAFNIKSVNDRWESKWTIAYGSDAAGLHAASSQGYNVVLWSTNADASVWAFQEVELDEAEVEAARSAQQAYDDLTKNKTAIQQHLDALFADKACSTLREEVQALPPEQLAANEDFAALNADMQAMVLKVKNDTWQQFTNKTTGYTADYERFFRLADYHIYSNCDEMGNGNNFTMSNAFGRLSGPTGVVANTGDIIYLFVDSNAPTGCTLQVEAVSTDGVAGNHPSGTTTTLKAGLNLLRFSEQKMLYILYQLNDTKKFLKDYPDIKIHIEGGQLQGYWDATRGMTNADWKLLQQDLLKASPFLNLKTERLVFQMDANLVKQSEPTEMEGLMHIWNTICANEDRYMGVEDFEGRYNNIWNCFSGASSYMHSTTRGTWYTESTIPTIMSYSKMSRGGGNLWGPSHEIGHNHQGSINVIGSTESSNNLFSNINTFESGILSSRRYYPSQNFDYMANGTPWLQRNIWMTTGMFFQLYLYFHAQHHDDQFLPNLFRLMRKSPLNKGSWNGSITWTAADGSTGTGANVASGANDYLHLAKMCCDAAQADLSEFFEAYGMFIPVNKMHVGDYSNYVVTTTQSQINAARTYMQKYEKKLGNIMFIDDRIIAKAANADNIFGCVPATNGRTVANEEYPYLMKSSTATYVSGDYTSFTDEPADVTDDYYTLSTNGKNITFHGTNYAGHKFYDADGKLLWATNTKQAKLPDNVLAVGMENVKVVTAQYDMKDVPCLNEATAIKAVSQGSSLRGHQPAVIHDLSGRRVSRPTRGLYIQNGRKVVK